MFAVEVEQEVDGHWIVEVPELPGVLAYGATREEAVRKAQALSLHVLAERLENGEPLMKRLKQAEKAISLGKGIRWRKVRSDI
jgi:predicted RNase H-like HicB family nuclease